MADIPQTSKGLLLPPQNTGLWHQHLNQNFELIDDLIVSLETTGGGTGTGDITINPAGGLESAANGVGIKLTASTNTAATSGLTTTASGTSVTIPYNIGASAAVSYAGRVQPLAASYFTRNKADVSTTYLVPHANAHQALVNRVFDLEDSVAAGGGTGGSVDLTAITARVDEIETTIGSMNDALDQILGGTAVLTEIHTALSAILRS